MKHSWTIGLCSLVALAVSTAPASAGHLFHSNCCCDYKLCLKQYNAFSAFMPVCPPAAGLCFQPCLGGCGPWWQGPGCCPTDCAPGCPSGCVDGSCAAPAAPSAPPVNGGSLPAAEAPTPSPLPAGPNVTLPSPTPVSQLRQPGNGMMPVSYRPGYPMPGYGYAPMPYGYGYTPMPYGYGYAPMMPYGGR